MEVVGNGVEFQQSSLLGAISPTASLSKVNKVTATEKAQEHNTPHQCRSQKEGAVNVEVNGEGEGEGGEKRFGIPNCK